MPEVYAAIAEVMEAIGREGVGKDGVNEQQRYKFRGIDAVVNALNPILAKAKLCILPRMVERWMEERPTKSGGVMFYITVRAEFDLVSAKDGSCHTVTFYGEGMDTADKATNKAMSAALKYACVQTFCIPTEGVMEDADKTTPEVLPRQQSLKSEPTLQDEQDQLRDTIHTAAQNWLKQFMELKRPDEFKRIMKQAFNCSEIIELPADRKRAEAFFETLRLAKKELKIQQAADKTPRTLA